MTVATGIYTIPTQLTVIVSDDFQQAVQLLTEHPAIKSLTLEVLKKNKKHQKKAFVL
ncbi:hypothetical protein KUH03_14185 [Sphingobacterium sp. E70]|uniref:hypothetical protein n=1 Tax=Sphingobacterium sp. E70 TaxID=2853439 RepID=UPI00211BB37B|nr:hypothetical protein [Sphingobacterium sp. E70]ULT27718.1 hypothetical protein KUH03_14185 [Sphingobacterium sp. E70]